MEIWKYTLMATDHQIVYMPTDARPLYAAEQHGEIVLYAHVNPAATAHEPRAVLVHGTGHTTGFSEKAQAMGVVALDGGELMFHVFVEPAG